MKYTNQADIPTSLALWLAHDTYKYNADPMSFSATEILKPVREIALAPRISAITQIDVASRIAAKIGNAIHDSVENTWKVEPAIFNELLKSIGIPENAINKIVVNAKTPIPGMIHVYTEKNFKKQIGQYQMTGTADFILDGQLEDFKTTGTFTYIKQSGAEKFIQQGSIYRWMDPSIITSEHLNITYIFKDWKAGQLYQKGYPKHQILSQKYPLMSLAKTESFIKNKLFDITRHMKLPQEKLPLCTAKELWQDDPVFKYYKNPAKRTRSTKNFDNAMDANNHRNNLGVGIVVEVPGKAIACRYCSAVTVCTQAEQLQAADLLDL